MNKLLSLFWYAHIHFKTLLRSWQQYYRSSKNKSFEERDNGIKI